MNGLILPYEKAIGVDGESKGKAQSPKVATFVSKIDCTGTTTDFLYIFR